MPLLVQAQYFFCQHTNAMLSLTVGMMQVLHQHWHESVIWGGGGSHSNLFPSTGSQRVEMPDAG